MLSQFISLQWKSFVRSASFGTNLVMKIFMGFMAIYFIGIFSMGGVFLYKILEKSSDQDPLDLVNQYIIYYFVFDLVLRYALQKMPIVNIKPLLYLPFSKNKIVHFSMGKTVLSFFNIIHAFLFVPFTIVLLMHGYPLTNVLLWHLAIFSIIYSFNFINIFLNDVNWFFYIFATIVVGLAALQFYGYFNITLYTGPIFKALYYTPYFAFIPFMLMLLLYYIAFSYFKKNLFLDAGLAVKHKEVTTENLDWLNRFGSLSTFLKNDIKLIKRNKRARSSVIAGVFFTFYGLLFFTNAIEVYQGPFWRMFAAIFVTGGFLFSFGQFVPSWDSSYYPLMMSQNIRYREYLSSKWWLMVIGCIITLVIASFYLYFGLDIYLAVLVGAVYNIGVNSHMVLLGGAFVKTPIDLTSHKKAFGDKQSFNIKTMLLSLPKLALPMVIYGIAYYTIGSTGGYIIVAVVGVIGFLFRNKMFNIIEKVYKKEKYKTLAAYKQKN
ncbi:DUF5687 family protein [Zhouia sp. PK063]|uniref:DUF5687 family protein n=1 Tax=Zhouia sp. PK063 TaxID=3373602 RepID=UPI00378B0B58